MNYQWHDFVGNLGVAMILLTYLLLQTRKIESNDIRYSIFNALGAGLILISLFFNFNLSAIIIEGFWVIISLVGIIRCGKEQRQGTDDKTS